MKHLLIAFAAALLAAGPLTVAAAQDSPADTVVARRGTVTVTSKDVRDMLAAADPEQRRAILADPQVMQRLVRERLLTEIVLGEAHAKQWDSKPEVIFRAERARETAISESFIASVTQPDPAYPSDAEVQTTYETNKSKFLIPRQYHLAQIFAAVPNGATPAIDDGAQKRLADLRNQVVRQKGDFAALARKSSDDKASAPNGGDLGWVRDDQVIPAMRPVVAGLVDGAVSDPIRVSDGWHLVRMLGTRPAAPATLADVRDALVRSMRQDKQQQNARAYLAGLLSTQPIELNEIALSAIGK